MTEKHFDKYQKRGSIHWHEMTSRDLRRFNAFQQARYDWILRMAGKIAGQKVLDLGCGDGPLSYLLAKKGAQVIGVDNEDLGLKFARENLASKSAEGPLHCEFVLASAYKLPFADESFDLVVNCEVIEHLAESKLMLAEIKRVLKKRGRLILTTPHRLREEPSDPNHVREYFPGELETLLAEFFPEVSVKLTHHIFWYGLFTYAFRHFQNRQFGRWFINGLTLWFGFNPFLLDFKTPTKQDLFTEILAIAHKSA